MKQMRQFGLLSDRTVTYVWLEDDKRLRLNAEISLKDDPRHWVVFARGENSKPFGEIHSTWKVGGL